MFYPQEYIIKSVNFTKDGRIYFEFTDKTEWCASYLKDYYPRHNYKRILKPGTKIRLHCVRLSIVVGVEYWNPKFRQWQEIWCICDRNK